MTATSPRFAAFIGTAISTLALQACSADKSTEPAKPPIRSIAAVSQLTQQAVVNHLVPSAPTVRVTDAAGMPVSGARVVFSGITDFPAVFTGADGLATITWTLTRTAGIETMTARLYSSDGRAPLGPEVTFLAKAIADAVAGVRAYTDAASVGFPLGAVVPAPAVVVVDQFSNGEPNVEVRFEATRGGTVSPASATTDANGVAYITEWKLGPDLGIDTLIARVGDLAPAYITAHASPAFHASAVLVANQTTCAISDGDVYCWGSNARGKVNVRAPGDAFTFPQRVPLPAKVASISGGYNHECAVTTEVPPQAYCWGDNSFGQLGVDVSTPNGGPFRVPVADGIASVAAGMDHTCGLTPAGVAYCWGNGTFGQLGTGQIAACFVPAPGKLTCAGPAPVAGDTRFTAIAAGLSHTCGIASSGQVYCWGLNDSGQLGSASSSPCVIENNDYYYYYGYYETFVACALAPQTVSSATSVTAVAVGNGTCALGGSGVVVCFGPGGSSLVPTTVQFTNLAPDANCGVASDGAAYCWTPSFDALTASLAQLDPVSQGLRVASITDAAAHRCAILQSDASLLCWGNNDVGQLGNGSRVSTTTPSPVIAPPPP